MTSNHSNPSNHQTHDASFEGKTHEKTPEMFGNEINRTLEEETASEVSEK